MATKKTPVATKTSTSAKTPQATTKRTAKPAPQASVIANSIKPQTSAVPTPAPKAEPKETGKSLLKKIEETAYFLAEKDGFRGSPHHYWVTAEKQVLSKAG
jgi:hypothetical protein